MSWRHGRGRAGYHHGNLREALIEAALALIPESGPLGFTFAEAARQAGSARPRLIAISATATISWPISRSKDSAISKPR